MMAPSFLRGKPDPIDSRNKSWYLQIPLGHRIGCADAPLTWSPITHFSQPEAAAPGSGNHCGEVYKGRLWTSTLTEPLQLESYSKN